MSVRFLHGDAPRGGSLDDAVAEVQRALCVGPEAVEAKKRILDFVAAHHEALHRTCLSGHLTGSALVIDAERERTLVLMHAKLGKWLQPGGHADGEGHLATVALDEAEEETGIEGLAVAGPAVDCDVHVSSAEKQCSAWRPRHCGWHWSWGQHRVCLRGGLRTSSQRRRPIR
jgi:hypothetical protein